MREEKVHARQDDLLMLKPLDPCPICGAETVLAENEPHPLHVNFEFIQPPTSAGNRRDQCCASFRTSPTNLLRCRTGSDLLGRLLRGGVL